ncbi:MAG: glycerate kinase [Acidimicrobiales bacterium]
MPRVVIAPDKFRGSATAAEAAGAIASAAWDLGWDTDLAPMSDGGEGFCSVLGGRPRPVSVHGPLGATVDAAWYELDQGATAAVEMAMVAGLSLVGGPDHNDPVSASTVGVGELIAAAASTGVRRVLVGMGGSASTDGGLGAIEALEPIGRLAGISIEVACDVRTRFVDAASVFAPQKGASPAQVRLLTRRLERLVQIYAERYGVDVAALQGAGAAGGLAGGLAAIGATLTSGFELVAERVDLACRVEGADMVITGEGFVDEASFDGKTVGGVLGLAKDLGVRCAVIAGDVGASLRDAGFDSDSYSLVDAVGEERAFNDTLGALREVSRRLLSSAGNSG